MSNVDDFLQSIDIPELDKQLMQEMREFRVSEGVQPTVPHATFEIKLDSDGDNIIDTETDEHRFRSEINAENVDPLFDQQYQHQFHLSKTQRHKQHKEFNQLVQNMQDVSDGRRGVFKRVKKSGSGIVAPVNSLCRVHYVAYIKDEIEPFDKIYAGKKPLMIRIGADGFCVPGLEIGISTMRKGEIAEFIVAPEFAYGELGCPPRIPGNAVIFYEVRLVSFVDQQDLIEYVKLKDENAAKSIDDGEVDDFQPFNIVIKLASTLRASGNDCFNNGNYKEAQRHYAKAIKVTETASLNNSSDESELNQFSEIMFFNMALCCNKMGDTQNSEAFCRKVLQINEKSHKAFYLLGQLYKSRGNYRQSSEYFNKCHYLRPNNQQVVNELVMLNSLLKKENKEQEAFCRRMFLKGEKKQENDQNESELDAHFMEVLEKFVKNAKISRLSVPVGFFEKSEIDKLINTIEHFDLNFEIFNDEESGEVDSIVIKKRV